MEKKIEQLFRKGAEFYECARHLHPRGCAAVMEECKPVVVELLAANVSFDDVLARVEKVAGHPVDLGRDPFLTNIKQLFGNVI